ncbi:acyl-CoA dehydrogenase, partial [Burkholderia gladioli]
LQAHLGAADVALSAARALLREAAQTIDANPRADAMTLALRTRGAVEHAAEAVLRAALRGLGAGPLCRDRWFARMAADLPVFMRQSHAERDLAALGAALAQAREDWRL